MQDRLVLVQLLTGIGTPLTYRIPHSWAQNVQVGSLVRVPLVSRTELAVVRSFPDSIDFPASKLKYIQELIHDYPVLTEELIALADWMERYYAGRSEDVFEVMIPLAVRKGLQIKQEKLLKVAQKLQPEEVEKLERRAPKQAALYRYLSSQTQPLPRNIILKRLNIGPGSADGLIQRGILEESSRQDERIAYNDDLDDEEHFTKVEVSLTAEQAEAAAKFREELDTKSFIVHLLHGVTGSGKTEVYIDAIRHTIEQGGGVIFLVPEVALAPQTVGRVRTRLEKELGTSVVVWHSHLSDGERLDAWHALVTGKARIVVGARSAVFAPVKNLRLLIVDEEHEPAYKQENSPRYNGRDVAVYRSMLNKALCVLGSATPSLETLYNVEIGKYRVSRLLKRIDHRKLPTIHVVDMTRESLKRNKFTGFSQLLMEKMWDRFEKKEQTILFLNRRGFSPSMICTECGWVGDCEHCSVSLTYHKTDEKLHCHLCGHERPVPTRCPQCKSAKLTVKGAGTQRVEDVVKQIIPSAKVVRIDADTMQKKNLFREILSDFRKGKIDILVGTQMIAKGLDFPNVTLVGLISADLSMHIPDFRAAERTFQLLVQVAGRAGRGDTAGEVVVQSYLPHSPPIQFARQGDFDGFQEEELHNRKEFNYPPYRHLIQHLLQGKNPDKVLFYAEEWLKHLDKDPLPSLEIRGPAPAPLEKMKDYYRFQIWYFSDSSARTIHYLKKMRSTFQMDKDIIDTFDVDPVNLV